MYYKYNLDNQMTQSKVYSLENIEMKKKDKSSDISFELN